MYEPLPQREAREEKKADEAEETESEAVMKRWSAYHVLYYILS